MRLLHLDSSITGENSVSRILTAEIVAVQIRQNPGVKVTYRDLAVEPAIHLSPAHMAAFQGAAVESDALGRDLALGAQYMDELFAADVLVIGAPACRREVETSAELNSDESRAVLAGNALKLFPRLAALARKETGDARTTLRLRYGSISPTAPRRRLARFHATFEATGDERM